jgi:hypothetical protein
MRAGEGMGAARVRRHTYFWGRTAATCADSTERGVAPAARELGDSTGSLRAPLAGAVAALIVAVLMQGPVPWGDVVSSLWQRRRLPRTDPIAGLRQAFGRAPRAMS